MNFERETKHQTDNKKKNLRLRIAAFVLALSMLVPSFGFATEVTHTHESATEQTQESVVEQTPESTAEELATTTEQSVNAENAITSPSELTLSLELKAPSESTEPEESALQPEAVSKPVETDVQPEAVTKPIVEAQPLTMKTAIPKAGLVKDANGLRYFDGVSATPYINRWRTVDGLTYYFGADTYAVSGLQVDQDNGAIYYFDVTTKAQYKERWRTVDKKTYYFNKNGVAMEGLLELNGALHYFGPDRIQFKNRWKTLDNKTYYFNANGVPTKGLLELSGVLHFFGGDGVQFKERWKTIEDKTYYFNKNGVPTTGLVNLGGAIHFFGPDGVQFKNRWKTVEKGTYYFNANGLPTRGYLREDGSRISYFFDPTTGFQKKDQLVKNGNNIYFANTNGVLVEGWRKLSTGTYYFNHVDNNAFRGLNTTGENVHYFKEDGTHYVGKVDFAGASGRVHSYTLFAPTEKELSNAWLANENLEERTKGRDLVNYALLYSGTEYKWDGLDLVNGIFCCGLTWAVHRDFDIEIPSIALGGGYDMVKNQYDMVEEYGGKYVKHDWNTLQPGDMVFSSPQWKIDKGLVNHTSFFAGFINGKPFVVEAVGKRGVILQPKTEAESWGYTYLDKAARYY